MKFKEILKTASLINIHHNPLKCIHSKNILPGRNSLRQTTHKRPTKSVLNCYQNLMFFLSGFGYYIHAHLLWLRKYQNIYNITNIHEWTVPPHHFHHQPGIYTYLLNNTLHSMAQDQINIRLYTLLAVVYSHLLYLMGDG